MSLGTAAPPAAPAHEELVVRRRRPLPNGRAVAGALLVVLAAVGTFGAYLRSSAPPTTTWLVAAAGLRPGQVLTAADVAGLQEVAIDLPPAQAERTYAAGSAEALVGAVVLAPVRPGDLLLRSAAAVAGTVDAGVSLSFAIAPERALGGVLGPGERLDVLATVDDRTGVVARDVRVAAVDGADGGLGGTALVVTLLVDDLATAQQLLHAADVGRLALVRGADPSEVVADVTGPEVLAPVAAEDGR